MQSEEKIDKDTRGIAPLETSLSIGITINSIGEFIRSTSRESTLGITLFFHEVEN